MANSPLQIVLNSSAFIEAWDRSGGGPHKDFYAEKDLEFVAHRDKISNQLSELKAKQIENEFSAIFYAKLTLKQSALAKSHRPTTSIFNKDLAPVVGGGDLGELFVELQPSAIDKINAKLMQAEVQTKYKTKPDGKKVPNPSSLRSEIGSIEEINPYTASDKRKFSVSEGLKWLSNPQTGGAYIIELFDTPPPRQDWDQLSQAKFMLFKSFTDGLMEFGQGLVASRLADNKINTSMIGIRLEESSAAPNIQLMPTQSTVKRQNTVNKIVSDPEKHASLIKFLEEHPLVKKIILPPIITQSESAIAEPAVAVKYVLPSSKKDKKYPKIGIVDGGVSSILNEWIADKWNLLSPDDKDEDHGTFIAGLILSGQELNGAEICKEIDGCQIIDLDLLPKADYFSNYYTKPLEFFKELEVAVRELKARTGVRIFNFSLNIEEHVSTDGYSPAAKWLDKIAEENDVIFIISAGNTNRNDFRKEWPSNPVDALRILASSRNDTLKTPAESCRNLSVSALNPPNLEGIVPYALSNYSCRGPAMRTGLKPDLAHIGGAGTRANGKGHGLFSINSQGQVVDGCGTSYAAPNVAKTLACLDFAIDGEVSRESLIAMTIHHATLPEVLKDKNFKDIAKHLVGFGTPSCSDGILDGPDSSITLVFANRIYPGRKMSFSFTWPQSLVKNGKCYGYARLTVVSTPPFDYRYGAEFVRVNIEGHLRQEQNNGTYKGRLDPVYLPDKADNKLYEKNQIAHAFKWSPIKVFEKNLQGCGPSTNWKLDVEYLARDGEDLPETGVPFTALLTISDPKGKEPVFNDMRQTLQSLGVQILDIKTAARIIPRV